MTLPGKKMSSRLIFIQKYVDLRTCRKNGAYLCMSHLASFLSLTPPSPQCNLVLFFGHKKNVLRGWPKKISMIIMMVARIIMIIIMVISSYGNIVYISRDLLFIVYISLKAFKKYISWQNWRKYQYAPKAGGWAVLTGAKKRNFTIVLRSHQVVTEWRTEEELKNNW